MRNLKRALSLTLASVMLLGMMVMGSSALSFNDAEDISNVTAATVLEELGVMQGDGKGNFMPEQTVTRAQMAILVCRILYGDKLNVKQFEGVTQYNDVGTNDYYTGYINLATQLGIINGYGDGRFGPDDTVTTAQAALMLCRALGWFQANELEGQDWALASVAQASKIKMFGDLRLGTNELLARDNVAEMVFNTMTKAVPVQYSERWDTYYSDSQSIMKGVEFNWKDTLGYSNFGLLYTEENEADAFGRPSITWGTGVVSSTDPDGYLDTTLGEGSAKLTMREEIITDAKTADKVYVGEVKAEDIYKDLNMRATITAGNLKIFENDDADSSSSETITKDDGDTKFGKDGQTVEIYYTKADNKANDEVIMVITSTYLGVVVDDDYTQDNKDGVRIEVLGEDGGLKFCEATGYSEDDLVLVTISDDEIQAIVGKPDTVNGAVSRIGQKDGNTTDLTISGKKYPQSKEFDAEADGDVIKGTDNFEVKNTYTLYLDKNGNYLAAVLDEDNATTDLVYVYNVEARLALSGENAGKYQAHAIVVYMDGTTKAVPLGDANISLGAIDTGEWDDLKGTLADLKYDEDDDEYTLTASGDYTSAGITQDVELKTDSRYAKFTATGNTYLNGSTVYVFVAEKEGKTEIDSVKVITGGVDFDIDDGNKDASAFAVKTGKNVAEYVVIKAEYEAAVKDIVYIKSNTLKGTVDGGYTFEGYYNNSTEKVEIPVYSVDGTAVVKGTSSTYPAQGFYEYSEKSDGTLKLDPAEVPADEDKSGAFEGKVINSIEGNMLDITDGHRPYDISGLKFVDLTDKDDPAENTYEANVTTLSTLRRIVNGDYDVTASIYVNADNEVTALFITNIADKAGAPTKATSTTSVTYKKDGGTATPTWAANDTVKFVSVPTSRATAGVAFTLTFKYTGTAWAVDSTAGGHSEPTGWDYAFNGSALTLTAKTAGAGKADPLAGTITVTVANSAGTVNGANAGASDFTDGTGTGEAEPPVNPPANEGTKAKLEVTVSYKDNSSQAVASPTWADGDKVVFTSGGSTALNVTATYGSNGTWTITGAPSGYNANFNGTKLTLEATAAADLATSPFGTVSANPTCAATAGMTAEVDNAGATWTPGVAPSGS